MTGAQENFKVIPTIHQPPIFFSNQTINLTKYFYCYADEPAVRGYARQGNAFPEAKRLEGHHQE